MNEEPTYGKKELGDLCRTMKLIGDRKALIAAMQKKIESHSDTTQSGEADEIITWMRKDMAAFQQEVDHLDATTAYIRKDVEAFVKTIPDAMMRVILEHHYLHGYSWKETGSSINNTAEAAKKMAYRFFAAGNWPPRRTPVSVDAGSSGKK